MGFPADFAIWKGGWKRGTNGECTSSLFCCHCVDHFYLLSCTTTKVNQSTCWYEFLVLVHEPECQTQINKP